MRKVHNRQCISHFLNVGYVWRAGEQSYMARREILFHQHTESVTKSSHHTRCNILQGWLFYFSMLWLQQHRLQRFCNTYVAIYQQRSIHNVSFSSFYLLKQWFSPWPTMLYLRVIWGLGMCACERFWFLFGAPCINCRTLWAADIFLEILSSIANNCSCLWHCYTYFCCECFKLLTVNQFTKN